MKRLLIIGAGGFGREVAGWARQCAAFRKEWEIAGFLDDNPQAVANYADIGLPVLGTIWEYMPQRSDLFICAIGTPKLRARVRAHFEEREGRFTRLIHESAIIGRNVYLEPGVICCPRVVLTCDVHIGKNTAINVASAIGHDAQVGTDCQISSFCDITGYVKVGDRVMMGSGARIIPGRRVESDATVGAGAVVIKNVSPATTVFGNPAKVFQ